MMGQEGLDNENQLHLKVTQEVTTIFEKRSNDETGDENNMLKLLFLHKAKLKVDASLQVNLWLYNEIIVLKKKMGEIHKKTG